MKINARSLTLALAAGVGGLGFSSLPAHAQGDAENPLESFSLPEAAAIHDYATGPDEQGFSSLEERVSYAIGVNIGTGLSQEFEQMGASLDSAALADAILKTTAGDGTRLSEDQVGTTLQAFQQQMVEKQIAMAEQQALANREMADAFFAENGAREGVVTTDSGLQYHLETRGEGEVPRDGQIVTLNYRGTLLDGTEFDSSFGAPEPASFPIGAVIPGFNEALELMPVGSKGTIWIPADLAYGDTPPRGTVIEPGSPLSFELEILGVEGASAEPEPVDGDDSAE